MKIYLGKLKKFEPTFFYQKNFWPIFIVQIARKISEKSSRNFWIKTHFEKSGRIYWKFGQNSKNFSDFLVGRIVPALLNAAQI